ncbi:MAG: hypothetical protein QOI41_3986, partial [Myxococcales bacterium]|nr:hypothetical protein [Myxococcales bacterium]
MSDRDVLDDAFDALREETRASSGADEASAAATRRQLLLAVAMRRRRRSMAMRFVLPLAAALAAGTAWAAVTGRLTELLSPTSTPTAPSSSTFLGPAAPLAPSPAPPPPSLPPPLSPSPP